MKDFPEHPHEALRLEALREYHILDTPREEAFDELARLAGRICGAAASFICFIDRERQWNKSSVRWEVGEGPRGCSIAARAIVENGTVVIRDTAEDPRTRDLPAAPEGPGGRFFAGAPLLVGVAQESGGNGTGPLPIGMLCVMDMQPRELSPEQVEGLEILARQVVTRLDLRRSVAELSSKQSATEAALRRSEGFYHSLVETIPQNIFRKDRQGRFTFANSRFREMVRRPPSEIIGKTDFDLFPPELALKYQQDDQRVLKQKATLRTIEQHQDNEGNTLWVQVIKSPLYDLQGEVTGVQGIFWDETERYKAEEALARERELLSAMLDYLPDSIYFKDRQSRFLAVSRALATRLGLKSPEEAFGRTDADFFDAEHARETFEDEQKILRTGQPLVGKTERESWAGGQRWVLTTKVPLRNRMGEITGTFGISKDITDLKAAEEELASARDVALESARLKSEFLANMSHEIRTPLNAVIGMTGLLLDTPLQAEQREFAETIRHSAEALLDIINDVLDFSKIEAGKLAIESIEFDLAEVVEGTAELLAESAQGKQIELVSWIQEDVPKQLCGDPGRVRQVLTNLAANAIKFTERGEVVINVAKERETENTVLLKFTVRDTGIGISEDARGRLFKAFVQADGSTTRRFGGTGLGLAISKQLVELMHGEIDFESETGRGSTFWFRVPFQKQPRQHRTPLMASTLEGVRVLVVDDNATNREIMHHQITAWRMRNGSAESGARALELLESAIGEGDPYQIVILDMQMPGMDGLALAREISSRTHLGNPRLIMLTSMGHLQAEKRWRECGISAYLIKPARESRLYDTMVSVLRGSGAIRVNRRGSAANLPASRTQMRLLVAEDNIVNQKVALRQLQKLGYSADAVANGLEVIEALRTVPYDVILMDCQMPELDGYETTRKIRARERAEGSLRRVYIVAMTANALAGDREACIASGMDDYISKPVKIDEIEAALMRAGEVIARMSSELQSKAHLLDSAALESLRQLGTAGEPDPVQELCELFLAVAPNNLEKIEQAFEAGGLDDLENAAHSLKGSASNIGAKRLAHAAFELMQTCRRGELPPAGLVEAVRSEFDLVRPELERHASRPSG